MTEQFNFTSFVLNNGMTPPKNIIPRKFKKRVIMHVSASFPLKEYLPKRFIKVAKKLIKKGFDCCFIVAPFEYEQWKWVLSCGIRLPKFASLDEMAQFIYESEYFIGNDSGIGHLASNLGLPTLSLFQRRKLCCKWRPIWSLNISIVPPPILLFAHYKEKYWRYLIPWQQVYYQFMCLVKKNKAQRRITA
jgi:ADP-heptose:LPS heptosyltransferase